MKVLGLYKKSVVKGSVVSDVGMQTMETWNTVWCYNNHFEKVAKINGSHSTAIFVNILELEVVAMNT